MTDIPTQFKPNANMVRVRNTFQEYDYDVKVAAACRIAKIGRDTYYDWFHKPGFAEWWIQQATEFFGRCLPKVYAALYKMATDRHPGNHAAAKILLDRFDGEFVPRASQQHSGQIEHVHKADLAGLVESARNNGHGIKSRAEDCAGFIRGVKATSN